MCTGRLTTLTISVGLCSAVALLLLAPFPAAWAHPDNQGDSAPIAQPTRLTAQSAAGGLPAYDSGWDWLGTRVDPISVVYTHNLGGSPNDYLVELQCRDNTALGTYDCTDDGFNVQAHWYGLTTTTVSVYVIGGSQPDYLRVRIYTDAPAYDSGWDVLGTRPDPISVNFPHNLGGNQNDYLVSLECWDNTTLGIYDCTDQAFNVQAHWRALTNTAVEAYVVSGTQPDYVRLRIYIDASPAYDSGWYPLGTRPDPISVDFTHNLGGNQNDYLVEMKCWDNTAIGTYDCTDNVFNVQAHWRGLTDAVIRVYVAGGTQPDYIRVRILQPYTIYLPLILRNSGG
jgi:hypothetical protein